MADLSDVTAALLTLATTAIYPNGSLQPSVSGTPVRLFEGWPTAQQLDLDMQGLALDCVTSQVSSNGVGPVSNVSVFPMAGAGARVFQVLDQPYVIVPPAYGLTATRDGQTITLSGTPTDGEFLTVETDFRYIYSRGGASAAAICAALAADAVANYPSASASGNTLTIPASEFVLRLGAPATMGQVTHRQRHTIIISVWAPTPALRTQLAAAIDVAFKSKLKIELPDTSQAIVVYDRAIQSDTWESLSVYRRDLYYTVEYATLETWTAYVVTSVTTQFAPKEPLSGPNTGPPISTIN